MKIVVDLETIWEDDDFVADRVRRVILEEIDECVRREVRTALMECGLPELARLGAEKRLQLAVDEMKRIGL